MTIAQLITNFVSFPENKQFELSALVAFVNQYASKEVAASSIDRVLRKMRQSGRINYRVINRQQSKYEVLPVEPKAA